MKNTITEDIQKHLECLGYEINASTDGDTDQFICEHPAWSNITVRITKDFVLMQSWYIIKPIPESVEFYKLFEELHKTVLVSRWNSFVSEKDSAIVLDIEAYAYGYDKQNFGKLLVQYEKEIHEHLGKFYKFGNEK
ncbi:MAG: hypothetical protein WC551_04540 [Patescibacteria group bacterium]